MDALYVLCRCRAYIFFDHFKDKREILNSSLTRYIRSKLLTYYLAPGGKALPMQIKYFQKMAKKTENITNWQITVDMDEYPFIESDTKEGFLIRYLQNMTSTIIEVSMPNFIVEEQGDRTRNITIERINRLRSITQKTNELSKPMYRPKYARPSIHSTTLLKGKRYKEDGRVLKMMHYWGARRHNWGPDPKEFLNNSVEYNEVRDSMGKVLRDSLIAFEELNAFSCFSGP